MSDGRRGGERVTCLAALLVLELHQGSHPAEIVTTGLAVNELRGRFQQRPVDRMRLRCRGNAIEDEGPPSGRGQESAAAQWSEVARDLILRQPKNRDQFADAEIGSSRQKTENAKSCLIGEKPKKLRAIHGQLGSGICTVAHANLWRAAYGVP